MADDALDNLTLTTLSFLEDRVLRLEHLLYGSAGVPSNAPTTSARETLADLEQRFGVLLRDVRVYAELLKIYKSHPTLFQPAKPSEIPTQLSTDDVRAAVLAHASAFPSTASALTAVTSDTPVPDPRLSAELAALAPRMRAVEAMQRAQAADMAALRTRSEAVLRAWYEGRVVRYGSLLADVEGRVEKIEGIVRRAEKMQTQADTV